MKHKHARISAGLNKALVCSHPQPTNAHDKHTHLKLSLILKLTLQSYSYPQLNLKL